MFKAGTNGFTLLELMIVIAIIAIIAAIAVPNLKEARIAANEASAIAALRGLHSAQMIYREQDKDGNGTLDYAERTDRLVDLGLIPLGAQNATYPWIYQLSSGYVIAPYETGSNYISPFKFYYYAHPATSGTDGTEYNTNVGLRQFSISESGVLRYTVYLNLFENTYLNNTYWPALGK